MRFIKKIMIIKKKAQHLLTVHLRLGKQWPVYFVISLLMKIVWNKVGMQVVFLLEGPQGFKLFSSSHLRYLIKLKVSYMAKVSVCTDIARNDESSKIGAFLPNFEVLGWSTELTVLLYCLECFYYLISVWSDFV